MEKHQRIIAEYFKLYVLLNRANRHRDEKTSLEFRFVEAEENRLVFIAYLKGSSENAKIQLATWNDKGSWEPAGYSGLHAFEDHIVDVLLEGHECIGIKLRRRPNEEHLKSLFNLVCKNLRGLGIKN